MCSSWRLVPLSILKALCLQSSYSDNVQKLLEERTTSRTEEQKRTAWSDAAGAVKTYSDNMIKRWNKEIDVYLVFVSAK